MTVDLDFALDDEALEGAAGDLGKMAVEETIQPHGQFRFLDNERVGGGGRVHDGSFGVDGIEGTAVRFRSAAQNTMPARKMSTLMSCPGVRTPWRGAEVTA